jgi:hypothetical protein
VDTTPPTITEARVERVDYASASLSWRTSEASPTHLEYGPQGAQVLANRFQTNGTGRSHAVTLTGLRPSLTYQYRIVADDALGNRATLRGTFQTLPDVTPPGAATGLQALDLGNGAVKLTWAAAFDDVGIDHYVVYRGVAQPLDELAKVAETLYIDDTAVPGVTYQYAIQAIDLAGQPGPMSLVAQARATTRPMLLDGKVSPDRGSAAQEFTYTVVVKDLDGDAPLAVRLHVNGQTYEMRPKFTGAADFAQGVLYGVSLHLPATSLSDGFPTYQFEVVDGAGSIVFPDAPAAGPAVLGSGAIIPGLSAATNLLGLPGFEASLVALGVVAAALLVRAKRGRRGA